MGYNIRGIAKAYNGDYDGGLKDINKSLEIDPNYGYARFNKALTYELYENMDEALKWYNNALEIEEYVWSYYGIASIYGRIGDINNTMKYLNKAIQMDEGVKVVAQTEHDFNPVKDFDEFKKAVYN
jgi:tetratricopeptide (TPR) repeat protein